MAIRRSRARTADRACRRTELTLVAGFGVARPSHTQFSELVTHAMKSMITESTIYCSCACCEGGGIASPPVRNMETESHAGSCVGAGNNASFYVARQICRRNRQSFSLFSHLLPALSRRSHLDPNRLSSSKKNCKVASPYADEEITSIKTTDNFKSRAANPESKVTYLKHSNYVKETPLFP